MTTIVTVFFDINREKLGDGRSVSEYLSWFSKTLKLNCNMYIVTEEKFKDFVQENRPSNYRTYVNIDVLENASYYKYRDKINKILTSSNYKERIEYPDRVECKLPEYNIIQYSKFGWLEEAIKTNPFNSDYFFWMDAGLSRFFYNFNLVNVFPSVKGNNFINNSNNKFIIQERHDINNYNIDDKYIWKADNLFKGGIFGGHKSVIPIISNKIEQIFNQKMLKNNNVNNEQLALALLWKNEPNLFYNVPDIQRLPAVIFQLLSQ